MAPEQRVSIDGIRYVAEMLGLNAERLHTDLVSVTWIPESAPKPHRLFAFCLTDAWSIVDNLWRLNVLVRHMRGLRRTPELEVHLRTLKQVEEFRHGYQHLEGQIRLCVEERWPLWGTLGWVFFPNGPYQPGKIFLMIPGGLRPGTVEHRIVNPAGKSFRTPLDYITLAAFGRELELSKLLRTAGSLIGGIEEGLKSASAGQPGGGGDFLLSVEYVPETEKEVYKESKQTDT